MLSLPACAPEGGGLTGDDAGVFGAVIRSRLAYRKENPSEPPKIVVLRTTLRPCSEDERRSDCLPPQRLAALPKDLSERSRSSQVIPAAKDERVLLASAEMLDALFRNGPAGWAEFPSAFPEAHEIIKMSAPSYSGEEAVIYFTYGSGPISGAGGLLHLKKKDGLWVVGDFQALWVS